MLISSSLKLENCYNVVLKNATGMGDSTVFPCSIKYALALSCAHNTWHIVDSE